ncbi:MBL fold metallo-hydrolase [Chloroflexota bacterium]
MEIKITTLTENTANYGCIAEWGLSILVEVDDMRILVDTGLSFSAAHNARMMGIDLSGLDCIVLSHGHCDHTGGLRNILQMSGEVKVIGHPDIWDRKYVRRSQNEPEKYNGIPFTCDELESYGARFTLSREPVAITDRIMTTGEIPMLSSYETLEKNLFVKNGNSFSPDKLDDDLALVINTDFGLVVITGCAHRGLINTLWHAQKVTGNELVYAAIGGTHLMRASDERIENTIADLQSIGIQKLGVSHCTGFQATARLSQAFEDEFIINNAGTRIRLPQL